MVKKVPQTNPVFVKKLYSPAVRDKFFFFTVASTFFKFFKFYQPNFAIYVILIHDH